MKLYRLILKNNLYDSIYEIIPNILFKDLKEARDYVERSCMSWDAGYKAQPFNYTFFGLEEVLYTKVEDS